VVRSAASGVSEQPQSDEETARGALNRAQGVLASTDVDLAIGFEGGIDRTLFGTFAVEWCVICDRNGVHGFGGGPKLLLPEALAERVRAGEPLGSAIQQWTTLNTSARGGVFGLLTRGLVTRERANRDALLLALARFLEAPLYSEEIAGDVTTILAERLVSHFTREDPPRRFGEQLSLRLH
jgi:inosine/xanthosine triphosphatase